MTALRLLGLGIVLILLSAFGIQHTKSMDSHGIETQATVTGFEVYMEKRGLSRHSKERHESQTHQYMTYTWVSEKGTEHKGREKVRIGWEPPQNGRIDIIYVDDPNHSSPKVDVIFRKRNPHRSQFLFVAYVVMGLIGTGLILASIYGLCSSIRKVIMRIGVLIKR